jgi:hypothetical protein
MILNDLIGDVKEIRVSKWEPHGTAVNQRQAVESIHNSMAQFTSGNWSQGTWELYTTTAS